MPAGLVLHEGNTFALYTVYYDAGRHALGLSCFLKGSSEFIKVMRVAVDYMEVECFKLLVDGIRRANLIDGSVNLTEAGEHSSLPYLTLLNLAVTKHGVHAEILLIQLSAASHAHCR